MFLVCFLFSCRALHLQTEISEVFDKLHHVNGHDKAIEVTDTVDSSKSPKPLTKAATPRKFYNAIKANHVDDWNSLAKFEKLVKVEMENLAAAKSHQSSNGTTDATNKINSNNILKPEKHVSVT